MSLGTTTFVPTSNTKAYWKLEGTSDSSGNSKTLTNNNSVSFSQGRFLNAADFGSANTTKYLDIADNLGLGTYNADTWTVSEWLNLTTAPSGTEQQCIFGVNNNSKAQINCTYDANSGTPRFSLTVYNGTTAASANVTKTLSTGAWHNIVLVKNGTTFLVYYDGALAGSNSYSISDGSPGRANQVALGRNVFDSANFYKGLIDEVIVETGVWTAKTVRMYYQHARGILSRQFLNT